VPPNDLLLGQVCGCFGLNQTPRYYTVIISGVTNCPGDDASSTNGTFKLDWFDSTVQPRCNWAAQLVDPNRQLVLEITGADVRLTDGGFSFTAAISYATPCDHLCDDIPNQVTVVSCAFSAQGYGGIAVIKPFWYEPWVAGSSYVRGNQTSHADEFYICLLDHTACDGGCPDPDEPGVGNDWETYWVVSDSECP
jgi:hypothetical protein